MNRPRRKTRVPKRYTDGRTAKDLNKPAFVVPIVPYNPNLRPACLHTLALSEDYETVFRPKEMAEQLAYSSSSDEQSSSEIKQELAVSHIRSHQQRSKLVRQAAMALPNRDNLEASATAEPLLSEQPVYFPRGLDGWRFGDQSPPEAPFVWKWNASTQTPNNSNSIEPNPTTPERLLLEQVASGGLTGRAKVWRESAGGPPPQRRSSLTPVRLRRLSDPSLPYHSDSRPLPARNFVSNGLTIQTIDDLNDEGGFDSFEAEFGDIINGEILNNVVRRKVPPQQRTKSLAPPSAVRTSWDALTHASKLALIGEAYQEQLTLHYTYARFSLTDAQIEQVQSLLINEASRGRRERENMLNFQHEMLLQLQSGFEVFDVNSSESYFQQHLYSRAETSNLILLSRKEIATAKSFLRSRGLQFLQDRLDGRFGTDTSAANFVRANIIPSGRLDREASVDPLSDEDKEGDSPMRLMVKRAIRKKLAEVLRWKLSRRKTVPPAARTGRDANGDILPSGLSDEDDDVTGMVTRRTFKTAASRELPKQHKRRKLAVNPPPVEPVHATQRVVEEDPVRSRKKTTIGKAIAQEPPKQRRRSKVAIKAVPVGPDHATRQVVEDNPAKAINRNTIKTAIVQELPKQRRKPTTEINTRPTESADVPQQEYVSPYSFGATYNGQDAIQNSQYGHPIDGSYATIIAREENIHDTIDGSHATMVAHEESIHVTRRPTQSLIHTNDFEIPEGTQEPAIGRVPKKRGPYKKKIKELPVEEIPATTLGNIVVRNVQARKIKEKKTNGKKVEEDTIRSETHGVKKALPEQKLPQEQAQTAPRKPSFLKTTVANKDDGQSRKRKFSSVTELEVEPNPNTLIDPPLEAPFPISQPTPLRQVFTPNDFIYSSTTFPPYTTATRTTKPSSKDIDEPTLTQPTQPFHPSQSTHQTHQTPQAQPTHSSHTNDMELRHATALTSSGDVLAPLKKKRRVEEVEGERVTTMARGAAAARPKKKAAAAPFVPDEAYLAEVAERVAARKEAAKTPLPRKTVARRIVAAGPVAETVPLDKPIQRGGQTSRRGEES